MNRDAQEAQPVALPEFQPPRTAAAQDASFARHGQNHYMRFIEMSAFAARLERELTELRTLIGAQPVNP